MKESADELKARVEKARSVHQAAQNQLSEARTYITYTLRDENGAVRYVGRASGRGTLTPAEVMQERIRKGHKVASSHPNLTPVVEEIQGNRAANRGAEDVLYEYHKREGADLLNNHNSPPLSNRPEKIEKSRNFIHAYSDDLRSPTTVQATNAAGNSLFSGEDNNIRTAVQATNIAENTVSSGGALQGASKALEVADKALGPAGHLLDAYSLYDAYNADGGRVGENFKETAGGIAGGAAGGWGGAAAGAALGTAIFPGVGTVVGGIAGGIVGGIGGEKVGEYLGGLF